MATHVSNGFSTALHEDRQAIRVLIRLDTVSVSGVVYVHPRRARISDALEGMLRDERLLIPVTDAVLQDDRGNEQRMPLLLVTKSRILAFGVADEA